MQVQTILFDSFSRLQIEEKLNKNREQKFPFNCYGQDKGQRMKVLLEILTVFFKWQRDSTSVNQVHPACQTQELHITDSVSTFLGNE